MITRPERVTVRVPAKINLHLGVGPLRADGYHELTTVFQAVGLYDELTVSPAPALHVKVTGEGSGEEPHDAAGTVGHVPRDATNLAARALTAVTARVGASSAYEIALHKGIPVAGGLAGGSADAAGALLAGLSLTGAELSRGELDRLAADLGSDVPFALHGGTALGTGRGERLTPVLGHGRYSWVLALASGGLSTPDVFDELDRQRARAHAAGHVQVVADHTPVVAALRTGEPEQLGRVLHNDLQPAALALAPELQGVLDAAHDAGALGAIVSGSGPTVMALARDEQDAVRLAGRIAESGTCRAVRVADGPVHGARVVSRTGR